MRESLDPIAILMAEDDPDDCLLARLALKQARLANPLHIVQDGEQLMDYLRCRGAYSAPGAAPRPGLILLDLNMPRMDGRDALGEIKSDPGLRRIPVVALTTSRAEEDILRTYELGVNSYCTKPVPFDGLVALLKSLTDYWFQIVELPKNAGAE
jgi:CheY-like chemotaxis protein